MMRDNGYSADAPLIYEIFRKSPCESNNSTYHLPCRPTDEQVASQMESTITMAEVLFHAGLWFRVTFRMILASISADQSTTIMKPKKKQKKLRITEADYMLAQRRAARMEEISEHGRPVSMRTALHKSKKVYDRKRLKRTDINPDDGCPFRIKCLSL